MKITWKENELIQFYYQLNESELISTTSINTKIGYNRTAVWTYLNRLEKKGILEVVEYGKPIKYRATEFFTFIY